MYERKLSSRSCYRRELFNRVFFQTIIGILPPNYDEVIQYLNEIKKDDNGCWIVEDANGDRDGEVFKGSCLQLNGTDMYGDLRDITSPNNDCSHYIEFIYTGKVNSYVLASRVGSLGGLGLFIDGNSRLYAIVGSAFDAGREITTLSTGDYIKIYTSYNDSTNEISYFGYINNQPVSGNYTSAQTYTSGQPYIIGNRWNTVGTPATFFSQDCLAEISIYNKLLSQEEIDDRFKGITPSTGVLWSSDFADYGVGGEGRIIKNKLGDGNNATLVGTITANDPDNNTWNEDIRARSYRNEYGYNEGAYLKNSTVVNEGYTDTGVKPNQDTKFCIVTSIKPSSTDDLFGCAETPPFGTPRFYLGEVGGFFALRYGTSAFTSTTPFDDEIHKFEIREDKHFYIDDVDVFDLSNVPDFQMTQNFYLGAINGGGSISRNITQEIYYAEFDGIKIDLSSATLKIYTQADLNNLNFDILGNKLEQKGRVKLNDKVVKSNILTFNGIDNYFKDEVMLSDTSKVVYKGIIRTFTGNAVLYGARTAQANKAFNIFRLGNFLRIDYGTQQQGISLLGNNINIGDAFSVEIDNGVVKLNDSVVHTFSPTPFTTEFEIYIGALNNGGTASFFDASSLIEYAHYENDFLVSRFTAKEGLGNIIYNTAGGYSIIQGIDNGLWSQSNDCIEPTNLTKGFSPALVSDKIIVNNVIDLGYAEKIEYKTELQVEFLEGNVDQNIWGAYGVGGARGLALLSGNLRVVNNGGLSNTTQAYEINKLYSIVINDDNGKWTINGTEFFTDTTNVDATINSVAFAQNYQGDIDFKQGDVKFHSIKVWNKNTGELIKEYIPVVQGTYTEAGRAEFNGLYDRVNKEFYYSDATNKNMDIVRIPAKDGSKTETALGTELLNPPTTNYHNGSENGLIKPEAPELYDVESNFDYKPWFGKDISFGEATINSGNEISTISSVNNGKIVNLKVTTAGTNQSRPSVRFPVSQIILSGETHRLMFRYKVNSGSVRIYGVWDGTAINVLSDELTGSGTYTTDTLYTANRGDVIIYFDGTNEFDLDINNIKIVNINDKEPIPYYYKDIYPDYENKHLWFNDVFSESPNKKNGLVYKSEQGGETLYKIYDFLNIPYYNLDFSEEENSMYATLI